MVLTVALHPHPSHATVTVTVGNDTRDPVTLAAPRLGIPTFDGSYFQFDPNRCHYTGRAVKRAFYPDDSLLRLAPGGVLRCDVNLSHSYRGVDAGLRVRYIASHPTPDRASDTTLLVSNWVIL